MLEEKTTKELVDTLYFTLELMQDKDYINAEIALGDFIVKHAAELINYEIITDNP